MEAELLMEYMEWYRNTTINVDGYPNEDLIRMFMNQRDN